MHIYFSGIGGTAIGPLSIIAKEAGHEVSGSDLKNSDFLQDMIKKGYDAHIGQTKEQIQKIHEENPIDWLVHSSAVTKSNPEFKFALKHNIRISKRSELINKILEDKGLKMVAVAGTHGKTTTTAMIIWLMQKLNQPISYSVGTTLSFGAVSQYVEGSEYFVYEADEFDRNFLDYNPYTSLLTSVEYDHPDTYPSVADYKAAFSEFVSNSKHVVGWEKDIKNNSLQAKNVMALPDNFEMVEKIDLFGEHNRQNACLAVLTVNKLLPQHSTEKLLDIIAQFPGTDRRLEKIKDNLYSDYAHHPSEIIATIKTAKEITKASGKKLAIVYQPHQNVRQHEINDTSGYTNTFNNVDRLYWLPTYMSREKEELSVISPQDLARSVRDPKDIVFAELNSELVENIQQSIVDGYLVVLMAAGDLDTFIRSALA